MSLSNARPERKQAYLMKRGTGVSPCKGTTQATVAITEPVLHCHSIKTGTSQPSQQRKGVGGVTNRTPCIDIHRTHFSGKNIRGYPLTLLVVKAV